MADGTTKPIDQISPNMKTMGFSLDTLKTSESMVMSTERHKVDKICLALFDSSTILEVTKDHLFYIGERKFMPVFYLEDTKVVGLDANNAVGLAHLDAIAEVKRDIFVYNFRTSSNNYIVTDEYGQFFFFVHNNKPRIDPGDLPLYV